MLHAKHKKLSRLRFGPEYEAIGVMFQVIVSLIVTELSVSISSGFGTSGKPTRKSVRWTRPSHNLASMLGWSESGSRITNQIR